MAFCRGMSARYHTCKGIQTTLKPRQQLLQRCFSTESAVSANYIDVSMDDSTGVAILCMAKKPVNSMNHQMLTDFNIALEKLENNRKCRGVIITSGLPRIFSAGLEITEMYQPEKDRLRAFWRTFQEFWIKLYGSRLATVAAINGHAPAGGCLISIACDHRVMASGKYTIGLNEVHLGFPAPTWLMAGMVNTIGVREGEKALQLGLLYSPEEALKVHLVDEVVPEADVVEAARAALSRYLAIPEYARQLSKDALRRPTLSLLVGKEAEEVEAVIDIITKDGCQKRMGQYLAALKAKKK